MVKSDIETTLKEIIKNRNVSVGIDKIGVKTIKRNGFYDKYIDVVFDALSGSDYHFTKYKQLLKVKGPDKCPRVISIPCLRDRLLLKYIYNHFLKSHVKRSKFEVIIKNVHDDVLSAKYDKVAKFDISAFFDNINHLLLKKALQNELIDNHIIDLLMKSIMVNTVNEQKNSKSIPVFDIKKDKGVPQGIIVGNALAEIFAQQLDEDFKSLESKGASYHRFVDDILVFYNSNLISDADLEKTAKAIVTKYKLEFQESKTKIGKSVSTGFDFLGFVFCRDKISITEEVFKKKINKVERVIFDFYRSSSNKIKNNYDYLVWKLNLEITGFVANNVFYGWTSSYRFINDYSQYVKLDFVTKKIYNRARLDPKYWAKIKSFVKAHNSVNKATRSKSGYIPNFDNLYPSVVEKRRFLVGMYGISSAATDDYVEDLFDGVVKKEIFEIERDLDLKYGI